MDYLPGKDRQRQREGATVLQGKAEEVRERLRGIADDVWSYATGQREAERAAHALESAGGALERATESFEPVVQRHELAVAHQREQQHQKALELERSQ